MGINSESGEAKLAPLNSVCSCFDLEQYILCPADSISICPFFPCLVVTGATDGIGKAYAEDVSFPGLRRFSDS